MRLLLLTVTASAGLALIFLPTFPVNAITVTTPASVRWAADALDLTEVVHCRRYSPAPPGTPLEPRLSSRGGGDRPPAFWRRDL